MLPGPPLLSELPYFIEDSQPPAGDQSIFCAISLTRTKHDRARSDVPLAGSISSLNRHRVIDPSVCGLVGAHKWQTRFGVAQNDENGYLIATGKIQQSPAVDCDLEGKIATILRIKVTPVTDSLPQIVFLCRRQPIIGER